MARKRFPEVFLAAAAIVALAIVALLAASAPAPSTTSTSKGSLVTSNPSPYFPNGYESLRVNFSSIHNGDILNVGGTQIRYYVPSNLETRTTTTNSTSTVIVVTADYQCGTSMGQRRFFEARLANGSDFQLDYCLVLNTAIAQGAYRSSVPQTWSLWEVSMGTTPTVAIHLTGSGENVNDTVLWVSK